MNKNILSRIIVFLFTVFFSIVTFSQNQVSVSGYVLDSKSRESLIGVTVKEKGTLNGTITDREGKFTIKTSSNSTLVFNYMGYEEKEMVLSSDLELIVLLDEKSELIDEVVVIGYGVQKKSDITGSISSVSGKDINNVPISSALQAMQGKASGLTIIQNTGSPGSSTTIKIRGTGTINNSDPLYVVDGFIVNDISHINPNEIANIEIFKDAASSSIYGARAANGIVVITTKAGEKGTPRITFDSYVGFSNPWKTIPVMDIEEYALMRDYVTNLRNYSANGVLYHSINETGDLVYDDYKFYKVDTIRKNSPANWWDAITQLGIKQQYNLSVSGGNDITKYIVTASYYKEMGIVNTSEYERFNTRLNLNNQLTNWLQLTANFAYSFEDKDMIPEGRNSVLKLALYQNPMAFTYSGRGYWSGGHPLATLALNHDNSKQHRIDMNLSLNAQLFKFLNYQFKASYYIVPYVRNNFYENFRLDEDFGMNDLTTVQVRQHQANKWEVNNLLTYMWNNNVHDINFLAGQIIEGHKESYYESLKRGTASNAPYLWYMSAAYTGDKTYGIDKEWSAIGFVGRITYNLLNRYLFQANFRADGSSVFSKENRWGYFPSVSVGWKFTSEPFMQNIDWLSFGKLRAGWGILGNNRIDEMARFTLLHTQFNYPYGIGNHILQPGITSVSIGNPDIRWEKTETTNIGIDLGFWGNSLNFEFEVFDKLTTDMLLRVPVPVSVGIGTNNDNFPMVNAGSVRNRGWEASFEYKNKINKLRYQVGFNLSYIENKVVSLGTGNEPVWGAYLNESSILDFTTKTAVGKPIGSFYGYLTDGIFNNWQEIEESAQYDWGKWRSQQTTRPGDFRFVDINGDGQITPEDRTYLGSPLPDYVFGIPISFGYGPLDLNIFFQGQIGNKVFNVMDHYLNNAAAGNNLYKDLRKKHWAAGELTDEDGVLIREGRSFFPQNLNASVPELFENDLNRNFRASDFMVKDGSYMRLKEMRLTWNFSENVCSKLHVTNFSIFGSAYNLLTFTKYNGFDPEIGRLPGEEGNNINMGIDNGTYPQVRTLTIGLRIVL